jgi:hypothetical protein
MRPTLCHLVQWRLTGHGGAYPCIYSPPLVRDRLGIRHPHTADSLSSPAILCRHFLVYQVKIIIPVFLEYEFIFSLLCCILNMVLARLSGSSHNSLDFIICASLINVIIMKLITQQADGTRKVGLPIHKA